MIRPLTVMVTATVRLERGADIDISVIKYQVFLKPFIK